MSNSTRIEVKTTPPRIQGRISTESAIRATAIPGRSMAIRWRPIYWE